MIEILLVEDHQLTLLGIKTSLQKFKNLKICGETASGKEAITLANELKPDVILMDISLHDLDGVEATKRIKEQNPNIKIIMLTNHESEKEILGSLKSGADGYSLKESGIDQIKTAIETVVQGDVWLSSQIAEKVLKNLNRMKVSHSKEYTIPLSEREMEVLQMIVDGKSNQEIAQILFLSLATAKSHVRNILTKLCVDDRTQAAVKAMREGMVN